MYNSTQTNVAAQDIGTAESQITGNREPLGDDAGRTAYEPLFGVKLTAQEALRVLALMTVAVCALFWLIGILSRFGSEPRLA